MKEAANLGRPLQKHFLNNGARPISTKRVCSDQTPASHHPRMMVTDILIVIHIGRSTSLSAPGRHGLVLAGCDPANFLKHRIVAGFGLSQKGPVEKLKRDHLRSEGVERGQYRKWTYAVSHPRHGGLVYARRSIRVGDSNVTILMHRVVIIERMGLARPSEKHFVDHENGDALDNRRVNDRGRAQLRWLTNKENMANRRGIHSVPLPPESGLSEIPY